MAMTIIVTRNVSGRVRGFLASCMCEVAPGVYVAPRMNAGVRERVWRVMQRWHPLGSDRSVLMTWPDPSKPGGQAFEVLGAPRVELFEWDGVYLSKRPSPDDAL